MNTITTPPPDDRFEYTESLSNGDVRIDSYLGPVLDMLKSLPIEDRAKLVGIGKKSIYELFKTEYDKQCDMAHKCLMSQWEWLETGTPVDIDDDFLSEMFGVTIKKQSLYKQLRERRADFELVYDIVYEFRNSDVYRKIEPVKDQTLEFEFERV